MNKGKFINSKRYATGKSLKMEMKVKDGDFRTIHEVRCDAKDVPKACQMITEKFGIKFIPKTDLDWLKKDIF